MLRSTIALLAGGIFASAASGDDRFREMFRWIPSDVNLMAVVDVKSIYASPLATRNKWTTDAPLDGFPPALQFVVLGSEVDPATLENDEEYAVAYLMRNLTMDELAQREGGARDTIADADAVLSPRNCYFVAVAPFTIGMSYPANRQEAAKWVRYGRQNAQPRFPSAIQAAISSIQPSTQFMLVLDLTDAIRAEDVRARIARSEALKGRDLEAAAKVLTSIQSLRLDLSVRDAIASVLTVQFGQDVGPIAPVAKQLLQEVLARHGASMDDVENWTAEPTGTTISYRGPLGEPSFRRLLSLLTPPAPHLDQGQVDPQNPLAGEIRMQASRRYYQSIQKALEGLKRPPTRAQRNYRDYALWYDKAADSIARLPTINVDPDMLKYGTLASQSLDAIGASARGEQVQVNKAAEGFRFSITQFPSTYWRGWRPGGTFVDTNLADVEAAKQQAIEQGTQTRNEIWANLMSETDKIRQVMYDKFKMPF